MTAEGNPPPDGERDRADRDVAGEREVHAERDTHAERGVEAERGVAGTWRATLARWRAAPAGWRMAVERGAAVASQALRGWRPATGWRGTAESDAGGPLGARLALASGVLLGVASLVHLATTDVWMLGINLEVYYHAARAVLAGGDLYAVTPPDHPAYYYRYPPVTVVAFLPLAAFGSWRPAFVATTLLSVAAGLVAAAVAVRFVERHGRPLSAVDAALVAGFAVLSIHAVPTLFYGNVNLVLAALVAVGFDRLDRGREATAGAALGVVALVKVFPAAFGAWLVRRRAWRAVAAAVAAGGGLLALGVPLFGVSTHRAFLTEALLPRMRSDLFAGGLDPDATYFTVRRPLSVLFPGLDPALLSLAALAVVAPVVAYLYAGGEGVVDRLVGVFATVAGTLVFFPSYFLYYALLYFPLVALLYLLEDRVARWLFVAGAVVANVPLGRSATLELLRSPLLPAGVEAALVDAATPALALGSPPLYGIALMLAGCVVHRRRSEREGDDESERGPPENLAGTGATEDPDGVETTRTAEAR